MSLLNSIDENFSRAASSTSKERVVGSVEGVLNGVLMSLERVEARLTGERATQLAALQQYDKLVATRRKYYQLIRDYQKAMANYSDLHHRRRVSGGRRQKNFYE